MNNYPSWYSTLSSIGNNLQFNSPVPIFNFNQPMIITPSSNNNNNYPTIAKDFLVQYSSSSTLGISCIGNYYNSDTSCSIHVHQATNHILAEAIGHGNFKTKLEEIGITTMKYSNITYTAQPLGKQSILITYFGQVEINSKLYMFDSTIILRLSIGTPKIANHILQIFM